MILIDKKIKALGEKVLHPFAESQVGSVCYDLTTAAFFDPEGKQRTEIEIAPGDSVFVQCQEVISLPADLAARVILRNRRIRQGLTLEAPLYQPGHHTPVYFRLTNITDSTIGLQQHDGIAALVFEDLGEAVEKPYAGQYQNELTFNVNFSQTGTHGARREAEYFLQASNERQHNQVFPDDVNASSDV